MPRHSILSFVAVAALALPVGAQQVTKDASAGGNSPRTGIEASYAVFRMMSTYIAQAAEEMSEADFAFRPTTGVRTFGQLVGHVAGSNNMFCAAALGETVKPEDDVEKSVTSKAGLIAAFKASQEHCARAYAMSDAQSGQRISLFGNEQTKAFALALNAAHNGEHYGNIVTYMRIKGMVPPSSRPQGR